MPAAGILTRLWRSWNKPSRASHRHRPWAVDRYGWAERHYRQALALAEELGMCPLQAHCHSGLGTLYAKIGRNDQARVALATAIDLYRSMGMTFWLSQAEVVLVQAV